MLGLAATAAGAAAIACLAWLLRWPLTVALAAMVGGIAGAMADSLLGATVQQRRRSLVSGRITERMVDVDGSTTVVAGGLAWLDNDGVNLAATVFGGAVAFPVQFLLSAVYPG